MQSLKLQCCHIKGRSAESLVFVSLYVPFNVYRFNCQSKRSEIVCADGQADSVCTCAQLPPSFVAACI